ncbi:MAG: type II toxin-antitoxin system RelB/DinJ family antitoxin [Raoultibacter sp.]
MPKEAVLQVRMDANMKQDAEALFKQLDLTLTEAVRVFIRQSVEQQRLPIALRSEAKKVTGDPGLNAYGILSHIADPSKQVLEESAWKQAVIKKYSKDRECNEAR